MPRRSASALAVAQLVTVSAVEPRLVAPAGLKAAERSAWTTIINRLPPSWFAQEQAGLLVQHVRHLARADALARMLAGVDPAADFDKFARISRLAGEETRLIFATARALRITNQSRHPVTAARMAAVPGAPSIDAISGVRRHADD